MATCPQPGVLGHLRRAALLLQDDAGPTDGELLEAFVARRDEAAFEALLRRHGPMVLGLCRRVLGNEADAEDAFQATFLVLVQKAAVVWPRAAVGNWLYGVAHNTALKAKAMSQARRARERRAGRMPRPDAPEEAWWQFQAVLDQELSRLPDKYRAAVVLCGLEAKSVKEAARQLGWPQGTVASRLARGRELLAQRLARHGWALSGVALAAALSQGAASSAQAATPPLVASAAKAASLLAAGQAGGAGVLPAQVAAIAEGVMKTMLLGKLRTAFVLTLLLGAAFFGLGGGALAWYTQAAGKPEAGKRQKDDNLRNALLALNRHYWEATARGDWRELQKFLADDLVTVSVLGRYGKSDAVEACKRHRATDWTIKDAEVVRVSRDSAVLTYLYSCKLLSAEGLLLETRKDYRVVLVWANRGGGWVVVFCHDDHGRQRKGGAAAFEAWTGKAIKPRGELKKEP